jgi:hypothetical protein
MPQPPISSQPPFQLMSISAEGSVKRGLILLKNLFIPAEENNFRPEFLQSKALLYLAVFLFLAKVAVVGLSMPFPQNIFFADITKTDLVSLLNTTRVDMGLQPLQDSAKLDEAAQLKAVDMVQNDYFAHQSPQGVTPWYWFLKVGYNYKYAGENLAIGYFDSQAVYDAWYNSPEHKANLLNPNYQQVGTAILSGFGNSGTIVVVQLFGSTQAKTIAAAAPAKPVTPPTQKPAQTVATPSQPVVLGEGSSVNIVPAPVQTPMPKTVTPAKPAAATTPAPAPKPDFSQTLAEILTYNYNQLLAYAIYGLLVLVGMALLLNIFIHYRSITDKSLLLRPVAITALLLVAAFINKDLIAGILPHYVTV